MPYNKKVAFAKYAFLIGDNMAGSQASVMKSTFKQTVASSHPVRFYITIKLVEPWKPTCMLRNYPYTWFITSFDECLFSLSKNCNFFIQLGNSSRSYKYGN